MGPSCAYYFVISNLIVSGFLFTILKIPASGLSPDAVSDRLCFIFFLLDRSRQRNLIPHPVL